VLLVSYIKTVILLCYEVLYLFPSCAIDVFPTDSAACLENVFSFEFYRAETQSLILTPTPQDMHIKDRFWILLFWRRGVK